MSPSFLVVGAGQIGVVFARHLAEGGGRVGLLVRPRHEAEARRGFTLYPLNRQRARRYQPIALGPASYEVHTDPGAPGAAPWDYVLLTLSSASLRGEWLERLAAACPAARFVTFQLGLGDGDWVRERVGAGRVIAGMLSLLSYAAPIGEEPVPAPGTAYWFPPGARLPFAGADREATARLVDTLARGGMPATVAESAGSRLPDFVLMALVAALELGDWRFSSLAAHPERARLAIAAAAEVGAIDDRLAGARPPWAQRLISPTFLRVGLAVARWVIPAPLEAFLKVHFLKVRPQMVRDRRLHLEAARRLGLPCAALDELDRALAAGGASDGRTAS